MEAEDLIIESLKAIYTPTYCQIVFGSSSGR